MRRRMLWVLGVSGLLVGAVLLVLDGRMHDTGGPGIIGFELAGTHKEAARIMADWGQRGQRAARSSLWLDFVYLVLYSGFNTLAALATRDLFAREGVRRLASAGMAVAGAAVGAGLFDAIEDVNLLIVLDHDGGDGAARAAAVCATIKFTLLGIVVLYLLAGLVLRARRRLSRS
jgi:hypothetical protein